MKANLGHQAEIELIRKIRNEFAHAKHGMSFANERVMGLCATLRSDLPEGAGYSTRESRFRFINSVVSMVLRLYYRPEWVALERRQSKTWISRDSGWRPVRDETPPYDVPFIAIVKKRED